MQVSSAELLQSWTNARTVMRDLGAQEAKCRAAKVVKDTAKAIIDLREAIGRREAEVS